VGWEWAVLGGTGRTWWLRIGANEVAKAAPGYPLLILSRDCLLPWGNYDATESVFGSSWGFPNFFFFFGFRFSGGYVQSPDKQVGSPASVVRRGIPLCSASDLPFRSFTLIFAFPAILLGRRSASCFFGRFGTL